MIRKIWFVFLFLIVGITAFGQTFHPNDSTVSEGDVFTTREIWWELAKADIMEQSYPALDSIYTFMTQHPDVVLEVSVHMDGRYYAAEHMFSSHLPGPRAQSIVDYLVDKGITADRLQINTEKHLLIPNEHIDQLQSQEEKEKAHQYNRRVEFKIVSDAH